MPSPFPGMDPFLEGWKWRSFRSRFITNIGDALVPQVRPKFVVDVEDFVQLEADSDDKSNRIGPDVYVADDQGGWMESGGSIAAVTLEPQILTLPESETIRQHYLSIRDRDSREVVTVIEVLSPWNKNLSENPSGVVGRAAPLAASGSFNDAPHRFSRPPCERSSPPATLADEGSSDRF